MAIGSGESHPVDVVRTARALKRKCPGDPTVDTFAKMGNKSLKNVERDIHARLFGQGGLKIKPLYIPVEIEEGGVRRTLSLPTIPPHEIVAALYQRGLRFQNSLLGSSGAAAPGAYWNNLAQG